MKQSIYKTALEDYLNGESTDKIKTVIENMTAAEFIATCKAIGGVSCETILSGIGIDTTDKTQGMIRLLDSFDNLVRICDKVLTRLDITGNGANLAGNRVENTYATYKFQTELVGRVDVMLTVTTVPVSDEIIIDKPVIDTSDSTVSESVKGFDSIGLSDGSHGMAVDATGDGVSVDKFIGMLQFSVDGAISSEATVYDKDGNLKTAGLVCTGDKLIITAFNGIDYTSVEHVVVIIGDINGDGMTDIADAIKLSNYYRDADSVNMSEAQQLAADLNNDGEIDIADAVKMANKHNNWTEYNSKYSTNN